MQPTPGDTPEQGDALKDFENSSGGYSPLQLSSEASSKLGRRQSLAWTLLEGGAHFCHSRGALRIQRICAAFVLWSEHSSGARGRCPSLHSSTLSSVCMCNGVSWYLVGVSGGIQCPMVLTAQWCLHPVMPNGA